MQRFVAQPQGSKTLQRNSCAMENFQIEQPTSRGTRNGVALGLLGLVAVALLLTPGALTGLAMADGFNGGAHLSASTARVCTTFDLSVVFSIVWTLSQQDTTKQPALRCKAKLRRDLLGCGNALSCLAAPLIS